MQDEIEGRKKFNCPEYGDCSTDQEDKSRLDLSTVSDKVSQVGDSVQTGVDVSPMLLRNGKLTFTLTIQIFSLTTDYIPFTSIS